MYGGEPSVALAWVRAAPARSAGSLSVGLCPAGSGGWRSGIVRAAGSPVLVSVWPPGSGSGGGGSAAICESPAQGGGTPALPKGRGSSPVESTGESRAPEVEMQTELPAERGPALPGSTGGVSSCIFAMPKELEAKAGPGD